MKNNWVSLAKNSNFIFDFPGKKFEFFIQEASIPGFSLGEVPVPHVSQRVNRPGDMIDWNPLSVTIIIPEDFSIIIELYDYILKLKNPQTAVMGEYAKDSFTGILNIITNKSNYEFSIFFHDAWVKSVGDITITSTDDDEPLTTTIDINYSYYSFHFDIK